MAAVGGLVKAMGGSRWLAIVFAAIGVVGALSALALGVAEIRAQRHETRARLWRGGRPPRRVTEALAEDGMYEVGVELEAREALDAAHLTGRHAPYVERDVDELLRDRLAAASRTPNASIIVLDGPSKAGKSRTVLEALRGVAQQANGGLVDALLVEPRDAGALATLAFGPPPREVKSAGAVRRLAR
jgi:hypothetical protein